MTEVKNIYQKLALARVQLQKKNLKKTGYNKYSGFYYFELKDFLPSINEIFNDLGLASYFSIVSHKEVVSDTHEVISNNTANLYITNTDNTEETLLFTSPIAEAKIGKEEKQNPIQQLGALHTYMRRYLWLEAMEIVEDDAVDANSQNASQNESNEVKTVSPKQLAILAKAYTGENLTKLLEINNIQKLEELSMNKASELISQIMENKKS